LWKEIAMSVKVHLTKEQQQAANMAKVKEAQALLASEVEKLVSGEDWQRYLELQARLHHYSPRNAMLIAVQHEAAYRKRPAGLRCARPGYLFEPRGCRRGRQ
jgi:cell division protein FtsB